MAPDVNSPDDGPFKERFEIEVPAPVELPAQAVEELIDMVHDAFLGADPATEALAPKRGGRKPKATK